MRRNVLLTLAAGVLAFAATTQAAPAGPSTPATTPVAVEAVAAANEVFVDCGAETVASAGLDAASAGLQADGVGLPGGDTQQTGTGCHKVGTGSSGFCDGVCRITRLECTKIVDLTGFHCACKFPLPQ